RRVLKGKAHYIEQIMGALASIEGKIAEMATGEGKTITIALSAVALALSGKGAHVVTSDETLARRALENEDIGGDGLGMLYASLGLTSAVILSNDRTLVYENGDFKEYKGREARRKAYESDIVYGTLSEFQFDYLRDNMVFSKKDHVQRGHHAIIIDEVDNVLIDEANSPAILSKLMDSQFSEDFYKKINDIVKGLDEEVDYEREFTGGQENVYLTDAGYEKIEQAIEFDLNDPLVKMAVYQSLHANKVLRKVDKAAGQVISRKSYHVKDGKVIIMNAEGFSKEGSAWSNGLQQAVEASEGVEISPVTITAATVTPQSYIDLYGMKSGFTGTATEEAEEFYETYGLEIVEIPTHKPIIRKDLFGRIFLTKAAKLRANVEEIMKYYTEGQPVLALAGSIEDSETLRAMVEEELIKRGIANANLQILNAKTSLEDERKILDGAGKTGAITIATHVAGRGTDIKLSSGALKNRGLHVIEMDANVSLRIERQGRGRAGRQGEAGSSNIIISLDDELFDVLGKSRIDKIRKKMFASQDSYDLGGKEGKLFRKLMAEARRKHQINGQASRKLLIEQDASISKARTVQYTRRQAVLDAEDEDSLSNLLSALAMGTVDLILKDYYVEQISSVEIVKNEIRRLFNIELTDKNLESGMELLSANINILIDKVISSRIEKFGVQGLREFTLTQMDEGWEAYLEDIEELKHQSRSGDEKKSEAEFNIDAFNSFKKRTIEMQSDILGAIAYGPERYFIMKKAQELARIREEEETRFKETLKSARAGEKGLSLSGLIGKKFNAGSVYGKVGVAGTMLVMAVAVPEFASAAGRIEAKVAEEEAFNGTMDRLGIDSDLANRAVDMVDSKIKEAEISGVEVTDEIFSNIISETTKEIGLADEPAIKIASAVMPDEDKKKKGDLKKDDKKKDMNAYEKSIQRLKDVWGVSDEHIYEITGEALRDSLRREQTRLRTESKIVIPTASPSIVSLKVTAPEYTPLDSAGIVTLLQDTRNILDTHKYVNADKHDMRNVAIPSILRHRILADGGIDDPENSVLNIAVPEKEKEREQIDTHYYYDYKGLLEAFAKGKVYFKTDLTDDKGVTKEQTVKYSDNAFAQFKNWFRKGEYKIFKAAENKEIYSLVQMEQRNRLFAYEDKKDEEARYILPELVVGYEDRDDAFKTFVLSGDTYIDEKEREKILSDMKTVEDARNKQVREIKSGLNAVELKIKRNEENLIAKANELELRNKLLQDNYKSIVSVEVNTDYSIVEKGIRNEGNEKLRENAIEAVSDSSMFMTIGYIDSSFVMKTFDNEGVQNKGAERKGPKRYITDVYNTSTGNLLFINEDQVKKAEEDLEDAIAILANAEANIVNMAELASGTSLVAPTELEANAKASPAYINMLTYWGGMHIKSRPARTIKDFIKELTEANKLKKGDYKVVENENGKFITCEKTKASFRVMDKKKDKYIVINNYQALLDIQSAVSKVKKGREGLEINNNPVEFGVLAAKMNLRLAKQSRANFIFKTEGIKEGRVTKFNLETGQESVFVGEKEIERFKDVMYREAESYDQSINAFIWKH
ncbi:MAG: hypothetical protein KKH08_06350, partial [Candidatus Omnitrophica bacterium]|nr:hypothetical protein [Candidatus Omnitrophota bacterium]